MRRSSCYFLVEDMMLFWIEKLPYSELIMCDKDNTSNFKED